MNSKEIAATTSRFRVGIFRSTHAFGHELPLWIGHMNLQWPFGVIEFREDSISLESAIAADVSVPFADIVEVELQKGLWWRVLFLGARTIRIHHTGTAQRFLTLQMRRPEIILKQFENRGIGQRGGQQ